MGSENPCFILGFGNRFQNVLISALVLVAGILQWFLAIFGFKFPFIAAQN